MVDKIKIAVASMMKNEGPYLLEWIAWHRLIGVDEFFIADNGGGDGMTALLTALDELGIVHRIDYPYAPKSGISIQTECFRKILQEHSNDADWIAFIDADEFIRPAEALSGLKGFFSALPGDVGLVCPHWKNYGSSGRSTPGFGTVNSRFSFRDRPRENQPVCFKSIVRSSAAKGIRNPHIALIDSPWRVVNGAGEEIENVSDGRGASAPCRWGDIWINHFIVKSEVEFWEKKVLRGYPDKTKRSEEFFDRHAAYKTYEPIPAPLHARLQNEIRRLKEMLHHLPEEIVNVDRSIEALRMPVMDQ